MRFDNVPWKLYKIRDLCEVVGGGTPSTTISSYWNGNILRFTPSEVGNTKYLYESQRKISYEGLRNSSAKIIPSGSILLTSRASIGDVSISVKECTTNQGFQSLIPKNKKLSEFIFYLIQANKKELIKKANGSTFLEVSNKDVSNLEVFIPKEKVALKIDKTLSVIDKLIETQSKIINNYEALIKSIEEKILWKDDKAKNTPIKKILLEKNEKSHCQDQYPVLSSTVKGLFLQADYFQREIASSNNIGYKITKLNDIIISPQNLWMGNITYNDRFERGIVSPSYHVYEISNGYNKQYIYTILRSHKALYMYKTISEQGASIVRRNLNMNSFLELTFPIPSKEKQDEVGNMINQFRLKLDLENKYLCDLIQQKTYLLNNLFI